RHTRFSRDWSSDVCSSDLLPYNVGTQLLINWLTADPDHPFWTSMTLMFQKEVGQRIVAAPGSNHYGRLGVLAGWLAHSEILFDEIGRAARRGRDKISKPDV